MRSKRFCLIVVALVGSLFFTLSANAAYVETFGSNNADWFYGYGTDFSSPQNNATWNSTGGNPGGDISGPAVANGNGVYAVWTYTTAPYGNMNGLTLSVDTKITGTVTGTAQLYVGRGGSYFISQQGWDIANDTIWTTHTAGTFTSWTGVNNNLYTLAQVLAAPDDIGLFFGGGLAGGTGTLYVDNYGTSPVPVPPSLLLLAPGLLGLVGMRKRFKI